MAVSIEDARVVEALPNLEVLVGTYEEFNLGFRLTKNPEGVSDHNMLFLPHSLIRHYTILQGLSFVPSFTNHSHCGSIRTVATCKQFLASGSTDESIRLFNLKTRAEYGFLQQHNGVFQYCLIFLKAQFMSYVIQF